jgi:hypothetical protein
MSLVLNVEILGEFKKLTAATTGAQTDLQKMSKRADSASKAISRSFAAIGVGLSFRFIANELEDATKAAIEDTKSQVLLANALKNTMDVTDDQIKSIEQVIKAYQFSSNVADDDLRPAYQKLALTTKSTTEANRLLGIALDISAGTGKDLTTVTQAMSKALGGSDTALLKLDASFKNAKDPLDAMSKSFAGAAEKAADLDPYTRMQRVFDDLQESVGMSLLPTLEKFAAYIASPAGQEKLTKFIELITGLAGKFEILATFAIDNADAVVAWGGVLVGVGIAVKVLTTTLGIYNGVATLMAARNAAAAASATAVGVAAAGAVPGITAMNVSAGALLATLGLLTAGAIGAAFGGFMQGKQLGQDALAISGPRNDPFKYFPGGPGQSVPATPAPGVPAAGARGNVNITINTPKVNAEDIVNTINRAQKTGFTGQITMPRS